MTVNPRVLRAVPITLVMLIVIAALVLIAFAYWRRGTFGLGLAMLLGGTLRAVLSERTIGALAVRGRGFDVTFYYVIGLFMVALTIGIS